jgi:hypothetical protein
MMRVGQALSEPQWGSEPLMQGTTVWACQMVMTVATVARSD